jgi:hypothetical protein
MHTLVFLRGEMWEVRYEMRCQIWELICEMWDLRCEVRAERLGVRGERWEMRGERVQDPKCHQCPVHFQSFLLIRDSTQLIIFAQYSLEVKMPEEDAFISVVLFHMAKVEQTNITLVHSYKYYNTHAFYFTVGFSTEISITFILHNLIFAILNNFNTIWSRCQPVSGAQHNSPSNPSHIFVFPSVILNLNMKILFYRFRKRENE